MLAWVLCMGGFLRTSASGIAGVSKCPCWLPGRGASVFFCLFSGLFVLGLQCVLSSVWLSGRLIQSFFLSFLLCCLLSFFLLPFGFFVSVFTTFFSSFFLLSFFLLAFLNSFVLRRLSSTCYLIIWSVSHNPFHISLDFILTAYISFFLYLFVVHHSFLPDISFEYIDHLAVMPLFVSFFVHLTVTDLFVQPPWLPDNNNNNNIPYSSQRGN